MKQIISIACLLLLTKAAKQYTATFTAANNKIDGTVTVDNGQVIINLDLSDSDLMAGDIPQATTDVSFADCVDGGLAYHIHQAWTYGASDEADKFGGIACGGTYTSGHWDPWNACGAASGNEYCGDGTINATAGIFECIDTSLYTPGNYDANPFAAEVGDWSGKYTKIELDADNKLSRTDTSFYEVLPSEMAGFSVVFHCNSGARAFCAPFVESETAVSATVPSQDGGDVAAYFSTLSDDSMIMLAADGTMTVNVDGTSADITDACTEFEYTIFEKGTITAAASGDDCSGVGAQYDPTAQCLPWSGNSYCTDGKLCQDPDYAYDCDFATDRYSCAPGDLSGKAGELLTVSAPYSKTVDGPDTLIPPTDSVLEKVIAIHCPYSADNPAGIFLACAPIEAVTDDDSAASIGMVISFIMAFISVINM